MSRQGTCWEHSFYKEKGESNTTMTGSHETRGSLVRNRPAGTKRTIKFPYMAACAKGPCGLPEKEPVMSAGSTLRAGGRVIVKHQKEAPQPTPPHLVTAGQPLSIKVHLHLEKRAPRCWACSAAGCVQSLRSPRGRRSSKDFSAHCQAPACPCGMLGSRDSQAAP